MIWAWRYFYNTILVIVLSLSFAATSNLATAQTGVAGQTGTIQSLNLQTGEVLISGVPYRLARALRVYGPDGRQVNPAALQHERQIQFKTVPGAAGTTLIGEILIIQLD